MDTVYEVLKILLVLGGILVLCRLLRKILPDIQFTCGG
jgi:hypothetical protein